MAEVLAGAFSKQALEPATDDAVVHPSYIVKPGKFGITDTYPSVCEIPIIDLGRLVSESLEERKAEMDKLRISLSDWGCFQICRLHAMGFQRQLQADIAKITGQFFALPSNEKQKYARDTADIEGYRTDPTFSENQVLDWSTRLFLKLLPHQTMRQNLWPKHPIKFSEVLKVKSVIDLVLKAMASSLSLEENCFSKKYSDGAVMAARFNHSHPCPNPWLVLGGKAYSDGLGLMVLLLDPEVEGLQVLKDDKWFGVPIMSGALIVHAGDQMQILSNGIFESPIHRVTAPSNRARISVAIFYMPDPELEIGPVRALITEERPLVYRDLRNYMPLTSSASRRERPLSILSKFRKVEGRRVVVYKDSIFPV